MRFLLAGTLATVTAAGLATIRLPLLSEEEKAAAREIREDRMHADVRFLSSALLEARGGVTRGDALARAYISSRFEAIGLEPGEPGGRWEQPVEETVRRRATANVVGVLRGRDPDLARQAVLYAAHHDHCGAKPGEPVVGSGSLGSAPGVAALLGIAEAFVALPARPRRSILFAAMADDPPGSEPLGSDLPVPARRLAAVISTDGLSVRGRTLYVPVVGLGRSSLDDWIRAIAEAQGRVVGRGRLPDQGAHERPANLSFVRAGVPVAFVQPGQQPSEDRTAGWDLAGAVENAQLLFHVGAKVADAPLAPVWRVPDHSRGPARIIHEAVSPSE